MVMRGSELRSGDQAALVAIEWRVEERERRVDGEERRVSILCVCVCKVCYVCLYVCVCEM